MNKFKVLALSATMIMATAGLAMACGADASSASAETASAKVAGTCNTGAVMQTAGATCASGAGVSATTVQIETVRMPSGAMAVFYHGTTPETVAYLQSKCSEGCGGFVCEMAKSMAADKSVSTEIAQTETGAMILVTATDASKVASVDTYEAQYAAISTGAASESE